MPLVDKPGRRKKKGRRGALIASIAVVIALLGGSGYLYATGTFPFSQGTQSATTTTCSTASVSVTGVTLSSTAPVYANISTSMGTFEVELFTSFAPKTVANFVSLSESGFYDNLLWWRVEHNFVIQTGDQTTRCGGGQRSEWGKGQSPMPIPFEANSLPELRGYLAMASTGPKVGGGSQFFINLVNNTASLDGNYAVFGKVIKGMAVVDSIGGVPTEQVGSVNEPVSSVFLYGVTILPGP
jgi:peptidyl-prolyl cis-trans isomerase B (cyclophilin B)